MPVSFDQVIKSDKVSVLVYKKNDNHDLMNEIKGNFPKDFEKFNFLLKRYSEQGRIFDENKFRKISGVVYEFKVNQLRVFCLIVPDEVPQTIVLHHYYKKQTHKMPLKERDKAVKIGSDILEFLNKKK